MKKVVEQDASFCDVCGAETSYPYTCLGCGLEYCYDCSEKQMVRYSHAVSFSGSGGYFCHYCNTKPSQSTATLLGLYRKILRLKEEQKAWYEDFKKRANKAEENLEIATKLYRKSYNTEEE